MNIDNKRNAPYTLMIEMNIKQKLQIQLCANLKVT